MVNVKNTNFHYQLINTIEKLATFTITIRKNGISVIPENKEYNFGSFFGCKYFDGVI